MSKPSQNRRQFILSCAALGGYGFAKPTRAHAADAPAYDPETIFAALPALMERENVSGLQVALIRNGQVSHFKCLALFPCPSVLTAPQFRVNINPRSSSLSLSLSLS